MGVVHKLKDEVVTFILSAKKATPDIGCRTLAKLASEKFLFSVSKSSVSAVLKDAELSSAVGRRAKKASTKKFTIPDHKKRQLHTSVSGFSFSPQQVTMPGVESDEMLSGEKSALRDTHAKKETLRTIIEEFLNEPSEVAPSLQKFFPEQPVIEPLVEQPRGVPPVLDKAPTEEEDSAQSKEGQVDRERVSASFDGDGAMPPCDVFVVDNENEEIGSVSRELSSQEPAQTPEQVPLLAEPGMSVEGPGEERIVVPAGGASVILWGAPQQMMGILFLRAAAALLFPRPLFSRIGKAPVLAQDGDFDRDCLELAIAVACGVEKEVVLSSVLCESGSARSAAVYDWAMKTPVSEHEVLVYSQAKAEAMLLVDRCDLTLQNGEMFSFDPVFFSVGRGSAVPFEWAVARISQTIITNRAYAFFSCRSGRVCQRDIIRLLLACESWAENTIISMCLRAGTAVVGDFPIIPDMRRKYIFECMSETVVLPDVPSRMIFVFPFAEPFFVREVVTTAPFIKEGPLPFPLRTIAVYGSAQELSPVLVFVSNDLHAPLERLVSDVVCRYPSRESMVTVSVEDGVFDCASFFSPLMQEVVPLRVWDLIEDYGKVLHCFCYQYLFGALHPGMGLDEQRVREIYSLSGRNSETAACIGVSLPSLKDQNSPSVVSAAHFFNSCQTVTVHGKKAFLQVVEKP